MPETCTFLGEAWKHPYFITKLQKNMGSKTPVPDFMVAVKGIKRETAEMVASEAVKFFKANFDKQGFMDNSLQPWQKSNKVQGGGSRTLYGSAGKGEHLRDSIQKQSVSTRQVSVIANSAYAQIHNEGGSIVVTEAMKSHFWKMYYKVNGKGKKAKFFKAMALKPVGSKIKIPKRQFMGNSRTLMKILEQKQIGIRNKELIKAFKRLRF